MKQRCILREQFLDRTLEPTELTEFAEMLRQWYRRRASGDEGTNELHLEAVIFAFPRQRTQLLVQALSQRLPDVEFDRSNLDELVILGHSQGIDVEPDLTLWREVLAAPEVQQACLLLRLMFRGPVRDLSGRVAHGTTTFTFCGAPSNGDLILKAIWQSGVDERMESLCHLGAWPYERRLLEAFDQYLEEWAVYSRDAAAKDTFDYFKLACRIPFASDRTERRVMWLTRLGIELSDERSPAAFIRRLATQLLASVIFSVCALLVVRTSWVLTAAFLVSAIAAFAIGIQVGWSKLRLVRQWHVRMRASLSALNSAPISCEQIDLATEQNPTLLKWSADLEALGARRICDMGTSIGRRVKDGHRFYVIDNATASITLLRKTEDLMLFPAKAIVSLTTRFKDGQRHFTINSPIYRKPTRSNISGRVLPESAGATEVLTCHRKHVEQLVAEGAIPLLPPATPTAMVELFLQQRDEGRQAYQMAPYSWGDAIHQAFHVIRREFREDHVE